MEHTKLLTFRRERERIHYMGKPEESTQCLLSPKTEVINIYQQFAPEGAGKFVTNVSTTSEFVEKYKTTEYIMVDITEQARQKGVPISGPTFSVFKKAI